MKFKNRKISITRQVKITLKFVGADTPRQYWLLKNFRPVVVS